ncbi:MAG: Wzz/FepE/Etk N-terminal domain-containing protein [Candidatus Sulfotelmatobacter sp.]
MLWNGRRFIAKMALIGLIAGMLIAYLLPKRYTSVVKLMPPDGQSNSGMAMLAALSGKAGGLAGVAGDLLGASGSGALFTGILQSRTVQDRLVQRFDLKRVYWDRLDEDARKDLAEQTGIAEDRKSGIITISVTDRDAHRATALAQAYVEELNRLSAELSTSAAHRERVFLEERLKAVKLDLDQAAVDFSQFSSKNTAIDIKEQARAMVEAAAQLQGELIAAESEQKELEAIYASTNPRVLAVRARITELRTQLDKLGGGASEAATPGETAYPSIRQLPLLGVKYADLYRQTKIQEAVYETLTQQYELAKVQEAKETPAIKVLDPASRPERRSFPPRMSIIFMCASFGLAAAVFWLIVRHQWEQTDAMDPRKLFAGEVLHSVKAYMPWAPLNGSRAQAIAHGLWLRVARRGNPSTLPDKPGEVL